MTEGRYMSVVPKEPHPNDKGESRGKFLILEKREYDVRPSRKKNPLVSL